VKSDGLELTMSTYPVSASTGISEQYGVSTRITRDLRANCTQSCTATRYSKTHAVGRSASIPRRWSRWVHWRPVSRC